LKGERERSGKISRIVLVAGVTCFLLAVLFAQDIAVAAFRPCTGHELEQKTCDDPGDCTNACAHSCESAVKCRQCCMHFAVHQPSFDKCLEYCDAVWKPDPIGS